jgi:zinc D-Ala-D-Ala carboxypeptidase
VKLTEHFALDELLRSQAAARSGVDLDPPPVIIDQLTRLCTDVLEPLRVLLGKPIVITSGWRPRWLNNLIGGAPNSAHLTGRAADIHVAGMPAIELAKYIRNRDLPADKVINEFGQWVHVQVSQSPDVAPRRQYLTARHFNGATQYLEGLA